MWVATTIRESGWKEKNMGKEHGLRLMVRCIRGLGWRTNGVVKVSNHTRMGVFTKDLFQTT